MGASRGILAAAAMPSHIERTDCYGDWSDASRWCHRARAFVATRWRVFFVDAVDRPSPRKIVITVEMVNSDTLDLANDRLL